MNRSIASHLQLALSQEECQKHIQQQKKLKRGLRGALIYPFAIGAAAFALALIAFSLLF